MRKEVCYALKNLMGDRCAGDAVKFPKFGKWENAIADGIKDSVKNDITERGAFPLDAAPLNGRPFSLYVDVTV